MPKPIYAFTITDDHRKAQNRTLVGEDNHMRDPVLRQAGCARHVLGQILPGDIGKRVYRCGSTYQVESTEQRDRRIAREAEPAPRHWLGATFRP